MQEQQFRGSISKSRDVLVQELPDGEAIFLNLTTEEYFGLDAVGTRIYAALIECGSVDAAYARVLPEFDVKPDVLRRDVDALVGRLVERQLVELREA